MTNAIMNTGSRDPLSMTEVTYRQGHGKEIGQEEEGAQQEAEEMTQGKGVNCNQDNSDQCMKLIKNNLFLQDAWFL